MGRVVVLRMDFIVQFLCFGDAQRSDDHGQLTSTTLSQLGGRLRSFNHQVAARSRCPERKRATQNRLSDRSDSYCAALGPAQEQAPQRIDEAGCRLGLNGPPLDMPRTPSRPKNHKKQFIAKYFTRRILGTTSSCVPNLEPRSTDVSTPLIHNICRRFTSIYAFTASIPA